jgi:hypothetical protein
MPGMSGMTGGSADLAGAALRIVAELGGRERLELAGLGWATVELARAERELATALGAELADGFAPAADDLLMGAYCRLGRLTSGLDLVLLEPNTEGRLAGALARWGEAVVVAYVIAPPGPPIVGGAAVVGGAAGGRRTDVAATSTGPLGPARLLASGRGGPNLILLERPVGAATAASRALRRATIPR